LVERGFLFIGPPRAGSQKNNALMIFCLDNKIEKFVVRNCFAYGRAKRRQKACFSLFAYW
jgi:hypothetical protein